MDNTQNRYCPACSASVPPADAQCSSCGARLDGGRLAERAPGAGTIAVPAAVRQNGAEHDRLAGQPPGTQRQAAHTGVPGAGPLKPPVHIIVVVVLLGLQVLYEASVSAIVDAAGLLVTVALQGSRSRQFPWWWAVLGLLLVVASVTVAYCYVRRGKRAQVAIWWMVIAVGLLHRMVPFGAIALAVLMWVVLRDLLKGLAWPRSALLWGMVASVACSLYLVIRPLELLAYGPMAPFSAVLEIVAIYLLTCRPSRAYCVKATPEVRQTLADDRPERPAGGIGAAPIISQPAGEHEVGAVPEGGPALTDSRPQLWANHLAAASFVLLILSLVTVAAWIAWQVLSRPKEGVTGFGLVNQLTSVLLFASLGASLVARAAGERRWSSVVLWLIGLTVILAIPAIGVFVVVAAQIFSQR